jgi:ParB-like chromosome segregation protein Spo0J
VRRSVPSDAAEFTGVVWMHSATAHRLSAATVEMSRLDAILADAETASVPLNRLRSAAALRVRAIDDEHVRMLSASEAEFPPVLVRAGDLQVLDGHHRVAAARQRGWQTVPVRLVRCTDSQAVLLAIRANVAHGLPLTRAERRVAAVRVIDLHPDWSDRAIAAATGLAAATVAALRQQVDPRRSVPAARVGRDGRTRPLSAAEGRLRASAVLAERPEASIREIAEEAGISLGTAHDVRRRLRDNLGPLPGPGPAPPADAPGQPTGIGRASGRPPVPRPVDRSATTQWDRLWETLRRDPTVRFTASGRALLQWLQRHVIDAHLRQAPARSVPAHLREQVVGLALQQAEEWRLFALAVQADAE